MTRTRFVLAPQPAHCCRAWAHVCPWGTNRVYHATWAHLPWVLSFICAWPCMGVVVVLKSVCCRASLHDDREAWKRSTCRRPAPFSPALMPQPRPAWFYPKMLVLLQARTAYSPDRQSPFTPAECSSLQDRCPAPPLAPCTRPRHSHMKCYLESNLNRARFWLHAGNHNIEP